MKMSKKDNFLALVPRRAEKQKWEINEEGLVKIIIPRETLLDRIARKFADTPKYMTVHLDEYGSCVWKAIDGKRSVYEIGSILEKEFGEEIFPLYERLAVFINILRNNKFITFG